MRMFCGLGKKKDCQQLELYPESPVIVIPSNARTWLRRFVNSKSQVYHLAGSIFLYRLIVE